MEDYDEVDVVEMEIMMEEVDMGIRYFIYEIPILYPTLDFTPAKFWRIGIAPVGNQNDLPKHYATFEVTLRSSFVYIAVLFVASRLTTLRDYALEPP